MRVLFDLNVVMDVVLTREPWVADSAAAFEQVLKGDVDGCFSAASLPTLFYLVKRLSTAEKAFAAIELCLRTFRIVEVNASVTAAALTARGEDFEDDLVAASAVAAGCDFVVTRDTGFPRTTLRTLSPKEFVVRAR